MKVISFTALTVAAYLILTNLLTPAAVSSQKQISFSSGLELVQRTAPESAPATGYTGARSAAPAGVSAQGGDPQYAQTVIDIPAPANYEAAAAPAENVPAATGVMVQPFALAEAPVQAVVVDSALETTESDQLDAFTASVFNGKAGEVMGVFAQDHFALPVVQQPAGQANYVATEDGRVTQFAAPKAYGTIGLLAHNYLSGKLFYNLSENQELVIVYGDGQQQPYRITRIQRFQALDPLSPYSNFIDVSDPARTQISASDVFSRVYGQPDQLVLQTCIEANGDYSWGRLFVTAEKVN